MPLSILTSFSLLAMASPMLAAAPACTSLELYLTRQTRMAEARRITATSAFEVRPADVSYGLGEGAWRLIWATPALAERGVFFFHKRDGAYRLVDTWGGMLGPNERGMAAAWARKLGGDVSRSLAQCFERALTAGK